MSSLAFARVLFVNGHAADHRGDDCDAFLALADVPAQPKPRVEAGDLCCLGPLQSDEERIPKAVAMKAALNVEPCQPLVGAGEPGDPFGQGGQDLGLLVGAVHCSVLLWSAVATRTGQRRPRERREEPKATTE